MAYQEFHREKMKIKKIRKVGLLFALPIIGCQSLGAPDQEYVYVAKKLSDDVTEYLKSDNFTQGSNHEVSYYFDESQSLIDVTIKAHPDTEFIRSEAERRALKRLCTSTDNWQTFIRESGVGVKYHYKDERKISTIGPWNSDVCNNQLSGQ